MPAYINVTSAPLSPPLLTPVLTADASVEDYERAIEVEKKKHQKVLEARERMLEQYNWAQSSCEQAQMALEQPPHEQAHFGEQGQGEVETPVKGQKQDRTPSSSNDSTPSKPPHKRVRSALNAEAPEFVPGFMHAGKHDRSSSG